MSGTVQPSQGLKDTTDSTSRESKAPLLSGNDESSNATVREENGNDKDDKPRKRDFFRFGKKPEEDKKTKTRSSAAPVITAAQLGAGSNLRPSSPLASANSLRATGSPQTHPYGSPASPGRQRLQSASPRAHSPSTSQIFERSVQEDVVPAQASPQIPSHIITENHIPPALDASSEAITNSKLDPDTVEIVTHASHQPAAATIPGAAESSIAPSAHEDFLSHLSRHDADNVSNYGSLDAGDVRRLSFISFADVVHAEQELEEQRRDSTPMAALGGMHPLAGHAALVAPRSPSPIRSPISSQVQGSSPSTSGFPAKIHEASPHRGVRATGSPPPGQSSPLGLSELNIETMRQALRKTGSGDLSVFRSGPGSTVGVDN